jgi:hypothetical protein
MFPQIERGSLDAFVSLAWLVNCPLTEYWNVLSVHLQSADQVMNLRSNSIRMNPISKNTMPVPLYRYA